MAAELVVEARGLLQKQDIAAAEVAMLELRRYLMNEPFGVRLQYRPVQVQLQQELRRLRHSTATAILQSARCQLYETIAQGEETTTRLVGQNRQLVGAREELQQVQEKLSWPSKLLRQMSRCGGVKK
jgi:hypothetical protein